MRTVLSMSADSLVPLAPHEGLQRAQDTYVVIIIHMVSLAFLVLPFDLGSVAIILFVVVVCPIGIRLFGLTMINEADFKA